MSTEIEVRREGVVVFFRGEVTLDAVQSAIAALRDHAEFRPELPTIWDFSGASGGGLDPDEMRALARNAGDHRLGGGRPRVALIVPERANFGGARMFAAVGAEAIHVELGIFRRPGPARGWAFGAHNGGPTESEGSG